MSNPVHVIDCTRDERVEKFDVDPDDFGVFRLFAVRVVRCNNCGGEVAVENPTGEPEFRYWTTDGQRAGWDDPAVRADWLA